MISVLLIDLNDFKKVNDRWGHLCGDQVLKVFSRNLVRFVRPSDIVCRWGGDEFLIFSHSDDLIEKKRAEELRDRLRSQYKIIALGKIFEISVSATIGVAQARNGESVDDLLARTDSDMYRQKDGRKPIAGSHCLLQEAYPTD